ncbi:MAG: hypothetical protein ACOX6S_12235 [Clostridia bacterium]
MFSKNIRKLITLISSIVLLSGIWFCYRLLPDVDGFQLFRYFTTKKEKEKDHYHIAQAEEQNDPLREEGIHTVFPGEKELVTESTVFKWVYFYNKCNHTTVKEQKADSKSVGYDEKQLKDLYPESKILGFTKDKVVFYKVFHQYCPKHFILKREDNFLGIYRTVENTDRMKMIKRFDIPYDSLDEDLRERIEEGIVENSQEDIESILENLDS